MRKLFIPLILFFSSASFLEAQIYSEDFESGTSGTMIALVTGPGAWQYTSGSVIFNTAAFPTIAAVFDDDDVGFGMPTSTATLTTPIVDVSALSQVSVTFEYTYNNIVTNDYFKVDVYDGASWINILTRTTDQLAISLQNIDVTQYKNENFQVKFTYYDGNGWGWGAAIDNISITTSDLSIGQNSNALNFSFYPNPIQNELHLSSKNGIKEASIFSVDGEIVTKKVGNISSLDVTNLASGIYILRVVLSDGKIQSTKIIKD